MKPWPDVSDYGCEDCCPPEAWCNSCRMDFEAHTKDAAMDRLRVAVEALKRYESIVLMFSDGNDVCGRSVAFEALRDIGPLP